jgi:hypothetical protein
MRNGGGVGGCDAWMLDLTYIRVTEVGACYFLVVMCRISDLIVNDKLRRSCDAIVGILYFR